VERFLLPRSRWAWPFLALFAPHPSYAEVHPDRLEVRMGALGSAVVPVGGIARISRMHWPWWGGLGVRIGRGMVAFAAASGDAVVVETSEPVSLRAPLRWTTRRIVLVVDRPEHLAAALAAAREMRETPEDDPAGGRG
jgi:hypothetical protein